MNSKLEDKKASINIFDILRICALFMVLTVHLGQQIPNNIFQKITNLGQYGVSIFFVLSGYLIFASLNMIRT